MRTPVDRFVARGLAAAGLLPSPVESPDKLLRRLSLDLTGLPPLEADLDRFLLDPSPESYDREVERLLASPAYGERQALFWLDLARYADTDGCNFDAERSLWPWRDRLIEVLNEDQPFDRFTLEQIAGDLLVDAGTKERVAAGFHRNTVLNNEGGVDPEEARYERLVDRTDTTATVWLGATFACARCHDHKYDPISQREYFGILAFFEGARETTIELPGGDGEKPIRSLGFAADDSAVRRTPLRAGGAFASPGEGIEAGFPRAMPWSGAEGPLDRRDLARWLVSPENPLTPRVQVNRIWAQLMGRGLVRTTDDLGRRAARSPDVDLLDWLAVRFRDGGWSRKEILRLIVRSATYRQSSRATAAALALDPENERHARGPRFRLEIEAIRDVALTAAGLLETRLGGPSVRPLEPGSRGRLTTNKTRLASTPSPAPDRFRRGIYVFWRRTALLPAFETFDAPSREICTTMRTRSNTPLQALALLNDPAFFEIAQAFARRILASGGPDDRSRVEFAFRAVTSRRPDEGELRRLQDALGAEREALAELPEESRDEAAWTRIANALIALDETVTKE